MSAKTLFIGENFSKPSTPDKILTGNIGKRLAGLLGVDTRTYEERFDRCNLSSGTTWDSEAARKNAWRAVRNHHRIVLLGQRVRGSFGFDDVQWLDIRVSQGKTFLVLPHPSGRSRWWNDRENISAARVVLQEFVK